MRAQRFSFRPRGHRGQVLVWFLAFGATLAVVFAGVYSVGQATSEKQKVVNATDAAAYSGGMVEARALNLVAYTNRSVIANEVLIAQMVSLDSWTAYFVQTTSNYQKEFQALSAIPYVGVLFKALAVTMQALNKVATVQEKVLSAAVPAAIQAWELLYKAWYDVAISQAFNPPLMALSTRSAAEAVLQQNVATQGGRTDTAPRLLSVLALQTRNELQWQQLIKRYTAGKPAGGPNDDRKYAAQLLLASRDPFSVNRPGSDLPILDALFGNASFCIPFAIKFGSEKQGPTTLVNYERWEAQDTLEFKLKVGPDFCSWGKGTVAVPEGWGRATAAKNKTRGNILNTSGGAGALAYKATHQYSGWSGVKALWDVPRDNAGKPSTEEASFAIAAAKPSNAIRNNEALGFESRPMAGPLGSPDLKAGFAKDQVAALSEARVFFARPVRNSRDITGGGLFRADASQEYASLYSPYWQVRLASASQATRALVYGFAGLNPALEIFSQ